MKIAVAGKGGVGKTTISATLAKSFSDMGYKVLAVDADPNSNLAQTLGFPRPDEIIPINKMEDLIEERTGARPGTIGGFFRLNPRVDDIPEKCCVEHNGIRIMVMGSLKGGGAGCYCPEGAILQALTAHLFLERDEVVVMDMEAGIEHLSRGTARGVDRIIVVVEPGRRSIDTAKRIRDLARDIGIEKISIIGNKVRDKRDEEYLKEQMAGFEFLGFIPYREKIVESDIANVPPFEIDPPLLEGMKKIVERLTSKG
jgi:CO dehydrogenase maturation factor